MKSCQIPLNFELRKESTFENFYIGNNVTLIQALQAFSEGRGESFVYLWGPKGVGRTHLLQACCHRRESSASFYLSLQTPDLNSIVLQGLETFPLVCLDDIEAVLGELEWEESLFYFYNRAREAGRRVIVVGNGVPSKLNCVLPDLRSRLAWGLVFQVSALSDHQKVKVLKSRAKERGLLLPDIVAKFLLHHYPRDLSVLFKILDQLDTASIISQRKLTIPFIKSVLQDTDG